MKVLLDECIDWRLSRDLADHQVTTARPMGWTSIKNGELLALASREFDVFVTTDRNLSFQQIWMCCRSPLSYSMPRPTASPICSRSCRGYWRRSPLQLLERQP